MPPLNNLEAIREQFGIPRGGLKQQSILNNRVASFDTAVSTPSVAPQGSILSTISEGAKKFIAGGVPEIFSDKPAPFSFKDALVEGVKNRKESLAKELAFDPKHPEGSGLGQTLGGFAGMAAPEKKAADVFKKAAAPVFEGFSDLSTKLLEKLKGRTTVSKQFIEEMTNQPDLKQPERDLIRSILRESDETVNVKDFANKVKSELLPLERKTPSGGKDSQYTRYENITLPDELRGPVANYNEHIYSSPIKTSAGNVHFGSARGDAENYFAHSRIEDLPDQKTLDSLKGFPIDSRNQTFDKGTTRRVIEIQSDLFQKGRLEGEQLREGSIGTLKSSIATKREAVAHYERTGFTRGVEEETKAIKQIEEKIRDLEAGIKSPKVAARDAELAKLEPYRNTWHERVIREEVKQAAIDGKTKLQFPTGETAMKIEGLGDTRLWTSENRTSPLRPSDLNVGGEVVDQGGTGDSWIITDVLGDGKFKAVPSRDISLHARNVYEINHLVKQKGYLLQGEPDISRIASDKDLLSKIVKDANNVEQFDISGKVDTENPIYRFYNKEVRRYLTNRYGAKEVVDPQGISWIEVDIKPEHASLPIEAYAALLPIPAAFNDDER